jgi:hypothetical protein
MFIFKTDWTKFFHHFKVAHCRRQLQRREGLGLQRERLAD